MKKIKLKFAGLGYKQCNQAYVKIYNLNGDLIIDDYTYNAILSFKAQSKQFYHVIAEVENEIINKYFYVNPNTDVYCLTFKRALINKTTSHTVTFLLTDYYYDNLPIMKGEMVLWKNQ